MGYSGGNVMVKWTTMPSHSLFSVPQIFPCLSTERKDVRGKSDQMIGGVILPFVQILVVQWSNAGICHRTLLQLQQFLHQTSCS